VDARWLLNRELASLALKNILSDPASHDQITLVAKNTCGTTACIAGHVLLAAGYTLEEIMAADADENELKPALLAWDALGVTFSALGFGAFALRRYLDQSVYYGSNESAIEAFAKVFGLDPKTGAPV